MSMTLRDLVDLAHLGLTVRAGAAGLNRPVRWAHVSELPNPAAWLEESELLLTTGIGVPAEPAAQVAYVTALTERRVAAIGIGRDGRAPQLSAEMLDAAEMRRFPVLEIPFELPFSAITRVVAVANEQTTHGRILAYLRIFETLSLSVSENLTPGALFERLRRVSGYDLYLEAPGGATLLEGVPTIPAGTRSSADRQMPTIPGGYLIPVMVSGRTAGYLAALSRKTEQSGGLIAVQHIGTIAAVEISHLYRERLIDRARRTRLFESVLKGLPDEPYAMQELQAEGLTPPFLLVAIRPTDGEEPVDEEEITHRLMDRSIPHLLTAAQEALLLMVPTSAPYASLPEVLDRTSVGVSAPFAKLGGVRGARREALLAVERAVERKTPLAEWDTQLTEMDVLISVDPTMLRALVDRVLGPVIAYDRERHTHLLDSLLAYFLHEGKLDVAARGLHIHKNTLSYRLRAIERLTERKLGRLSELYELCMAVHAFEFLDQHGDGAPAPTLTTRSSRSGQPALKG